MQKLQLSIPEPCHENWQKMTPTEQGRFCNACAKEVVDFSMMTDTEVLNYFTRITNEKVCGRALPSQLERTITIPKEPKKKLFWYWNYIVMFFMFFKGNNAAAQTSTKPVTTVSPTDALKIRGEMIATPENNSRIITGKVTDVDGNPVSFASIKIKATNTGVSADANGAYSLVIKPGTVLEIMGAGFKTAQVSTGTESVFNTVLQMDKNVTLGETIVTVVVGGMIGRKADEYYGPLDKLKKVAVIEVKDEVTGKAIPNASVITKSRYEDMSDTALADKKGIYKIKGIENGDEYEVRISAEGYEPSEFTIDEYDFKNRKKNWEVLLRKQKSAFVKRTTIAAQYIKVEVKNHRIGQTYLAPIITDSLYLIDGNISTKRAADHLSPDDISEITRLGKNEAALLFGIDGSNGAIVITTRKAKEIKLDEVVVNSEFSTRRVTMGAMVRGITCTRQATLDEKITSVKTILTDSIKVYPNPVQRNNEFSVQLKLKQPGSNYSFLITDATGKILLQQKFNASAKKHTQKIMGDSRWASGIYYIRIFDAQNKLISKSSFIFQ